ncbi:MAG TPA: hypothetical protein PK440_16360 [Candidatus Accumulibacter phosphatis]|nr:hypothetical protein [Candidatus Accumulibacter phosphatis]HRQ96552.1 hypothetical protein [Candidatus Accumulibacter phosphatis]
MDKPLEIKLPWMMIPTEYIDSFLADIRRALPRDHPLRGHELFPGIKMARRLIFIVDDDTTGERIRMDFEQGERWRKTRFKVPAMQVFKDDSEVAAMIERDHLAELAELAAWRAAVGDE